MPVAPVELIPFVDSHVHFWDLDSAVLDYDILTTRAPHPIMGDINGLRVVRFGPEEFRAQSRFQNVVGLIHVQVAFGRTEPVAETMWLQDLAERTGLPHAIVGTHDLSSPDVESTLASHASHSLLRGLRGFGNANQLASSSFRHGYRLLEEHDLVYHHCFGVGMFDSARRLAEDFPRITLCVDQAGMPLERDPEYFGEWARGIRLAAGAPNVVCKISSLGMVDRRWSIASLRPWVSEIIEAFGPARVFFGSNFPMDAIASSYPDLLNAFRVLTAEYSLTERRQLLRDNATRIYRLEVSE
ncbi:MAG: amidohydrolase family protein [Bifidobacteriaceae bacterium]|jgi:predicted TIM-barrel fold metal-dependent hydrolase|nr:amidohydrolase family protein [Bifidobacteriaceae bacterium]